MLLTSIFNHNVTDEIIVISFHNEKLLKIESEQHLNPKHPLIGIIKKLDQLLCDGVKNIPRKMKPINN